MIDCPNTFDSTNPIMPYNYSMFSTSGIPANTFYVDASRHLKMGTTKLQACNQRGINELFCDGHAAPVSPRGLELHPKPRRKPRRELTARHHL